MFASTAVAVLTLGLSLVVVISNASLLPLRPVGPQPQQQLTTSSRAIGDATEIIGTFNLLAPQSGRKCPRKIEHTAVDVPQPHSNIKMNSKQCVGDGSMTILGTEADGDVSAVIDMASEKLTGVAKTLVESLRSIEDSIGLLLIGLEEGGRDCGRFLPDKLEENTVVVILRTVSDVEIPASTLRLDFRYMMVSSPNGQNCLYTSRTIVTPSPSPAGAEPTEAPTTVAPPTETTTTTTTDGEDDDDEAMMSPAPLDMDKDEDDKADREGDGHDDHDHDGDGMPDHDPEDHDDSHEHEHGHEDDHDHDHDDEKMTPEPEVSPSDEPDDDDVCFPGDATVTLESGTIKRMDAVEIGDRVHIGSGQYSDVFMFSHKVSDIWYKFVTMRTAGGRTLSATKGHYIYLNGKLAAAKYAKVGDMLTTGGEDGKTDRIVEVKMGDVKKGLFNPQTRHGDIVVNDVRASTFTTTVQHCAAHAMMAPLRWMYAVAGVRLEMLENGGGKAVDFVPRGQGIVGGMSGAKFEYVTEKK